MKFFKPEDFTSINHTEELSTYQANWMAKQANAKLERESQVVYGNFDINNHNEITHIDLNPMHKALLLNIEELPQTVTVEMTNEEYKAYSTYKLLKSLKKDDFGSDASKTYKDDLFED